jgi:hypothetical protein
MSIGGLVELGWYFDESGLMNLNYGVYEGPGAILLETSGLDFANGQIINVTMQLVSPVVNGVQVRSR